MEDDFEFRKYCKAKIYPEQKVLEITMISATWLSTSKLSTQSFASCHPLGRLANHIYLFLRKSRLIICTGITENQ
jgi:hypothetical protein